VISCNIERKGSTKLRQLKTNLKKTVSATLSDQAHHGLREDFSAGKRPQMCILACNPKFTITCCMKFFKLNLKNQLVHIEYGTFLTYFLKSVSTFEGELG
jgi:hypothetical protein